VTARLLLSAPLEPWWTRRVAWQRLMLPCRLVRVSVLAWDRVGHALPLHHPVSATKMAMVTQATATLVTTASTAVAQLLPRLL
jgi:hypothetical protein